jgi:hypothetical protein
MTFTPCERTGNSQQRGYWLRCFLEQAFLVAILLLTVCAPALAQLETPSPIRLVHVEGKVVNSEGNPAANLEVTLSKDDKVIFSTRTNQSGNFRFDRISGIFMFKVARSEFAPAARSIVVRDELVTYLQKKKLYVILGPSACADACSSVLTSKQEFDHIIQKKTRH